MLGGTKEFDEANIKKLYQIRQKFGMPGKHPANVCLNKGGANCHNCGGSCSDIDRTMPGYQYDFSDGTSSCGGGVTEDQVAAIVRNVIANMK